MIEQEITRFDMDMDGSMEPSEHGQWVRYEDVTQPRKPLKDEDADMFWNRDDGETCHGSIEEFLNDEICQGFVEAGAEFTMMRAKKLSDMRIKITSVDEENCEAKYEIIEAAHCVKE